MAELHYFPLLAGDWLSGEATTLMTPEQEGAFVRLLCHAWLTKHEVPCSLPDDESAFAQMSRLGSRWKRVGALIKAQFKPVEGGAGRLRNRKQWAVYEASLDKHQKRVIAGQASAKARAEAKERFNNAPNNAGNKPPTERQQSESEPYSESESTNSTSSSSAGEPWRERILQALRINPEKLRSWDAVLSAMADGMSGPGGKAVPWEVLHEAAVELATAQGEISPHRFKRYVEKVLQRQSSPLPEYKPSARNGKTMSDVPPWKREEHDRGLNNQPEIVATVAQARAERGDGWWHSVKNEAKAAGRWAAPYAYEKLQAETSNA